MENVMQRITFQVQCEIHARTSKQYILSSQRLWEHSLVRISKKRLATLLHLALLRSPAGNYLHNIAKSLQEVQV